MCLEKNSACYLSSGSLKKGLIGSISVISPKMNLGVASQIKQSANFPALLKNNEQAYSDSLGRGKFIERILVVAKMKQNVCNFHCSFSRL